MRTIEAVYGADHPDTGFFHLDLGELHAQFGRHTDARAAYERALAVWQQAYPEPHPYVATTFEHLGQTEYDRGEWESAARYYREALGVWTTLKGAAPHSAAMAYAGLGKSLAHLGRLVDAREHLDRAIGSPGEDLTQPVILAQSRFALAREVASEGVEMRRAT